MNAYKRWDVAVLAGLTIFIAFNLCVWEMFTKDILTDNVHSGDYTRVGYITGSSYSVKPEYITPRHHIESYEYNNDAVDILTIGDSFSNSWGKKGRYYQDWIASIDGLDVLNIQKLSGKKFFQTIVIMLNSGLLDQIRPRAVLIETVERHAIDSFSKEMDMEATASLEDVRKDFQNLRYSNIPPRTGFLNAGNFKFLLYSFLRKFTDNAFFSKVYMRDLRAPFFNVKNSKKLIFAYEDIEHLSRENETTIRKINDNLNLLAQRLARKGIRLYFMPVVDKYNLYRDYLIDNPYPPGNFFEALRLLPKQYYFIDTKKILEEEIRKGEKDIYYADDSHWSEKAPKKIFETFDFDMEK